MLVMMLASFMEKNKVYARSFTSCCPSLCNNPISMDFWKPIWDVCQLLSVSFSIIHSGSKGKTTGQVDRLNPLWVDLGPNFIQHHKLQFISPGIRINVELASCNSLKIQIFFFYLDTDTLVNGCRSLRESLRGKL